MAGVLEGVSVGPLDPEATAEFGQVSGKNNARKLIRLHSQMYPPALRQALSKKLDPERTKALDLEEVRDHVAGLKLESGDPVLRDDAVIVGAQVRGERDRPQLLTFTYEVPTPGGGSRTAKWFGPYTEDALPDSYEKGTELARIAELKERGLVAWDDQGTHAQVLERENAGLRRERNALKAQIEGRESDRDVDAVEGDTRPDVAIVEENQQLRIANREMADQLARFEAALNALPGGAQALAAGAAADPGVEAAAENEPVRGYDDLNAGDAISLARSDDTSPEQRQAMLEYERRQKDRRSVVAALEAAVDRDRS